jgi:hypothetical protein
MKRYVKNCKRVFEKLNSLMEMEFPIKAAKIAMLYFQE